MLNSPLARLIARAVIAGVTTSLLLWQNGGGNAWKGAIVAGVLAGVEVLSPVNPTVGIGKAKP